MAKEKEEYSLLITRLGGEVLRTDYVPPSFTHLITSKPSGNEKLLGACTGGKVGAKKKMIPLGLNRPTSLTLYARCACAE